MGKGIEMKISAHSEQFNGVKVKHKEIKVKGKQKGKSWRREKEKFNSEATNTKFHSTLAEAEEEQESPETKQTKKERKNAVELKLMSS